MSDEQEDFEEPSDPNLLDDEGETEWVGEDEWGDEEEENVALVEEEVPNFVDNGDGTISDTQSNLMWKKDDSFKEFGYGINWIEAQDYCEMLNEKQFAGYDDWRLPSGEEAKSVFSFTQSNTDKDGAETHISELFEPGVGITLGLTKKSRIINNMLKNLVSSLVMKCGNIRITNTHIAELHGMLFRRTGSLNGEKKQKHLNANFCLSLVVFKTE